MRTGRSRRPITVAIADDHQIVREGVKCLIETQPDITVVGEASDGLEMLDLVERVKPRVVVVDVWMPGLNGLEATEQVRGRSPDTKVVVLSPSMREEHVRTALRNGAAGYVTKVSGSAELLRAIRHVAAGGAHLGPPFAHKREASRWSARDRDDPYESLSQRERQVLQLVAEGGTSRTIAARLGISRRTAETYREAVKRKLKLRHHADLIRYALDREMLGPLPHPEVLRR